MITVERYLQEHNTISRRTLFRYIKRGLIKSKKMNGRLYIEDETIKLEAQASIQKLHKDLIKKIKQELDDIILYQGKEDRKAVIEKITKIVNYWKAQGLMIKGYDEKSIYRKINKGPNRKKRGDWYQIKNPLLAKMFESHILPLAAHIYLKHAKPTVRGTVDRLIAYAERNEDFYEIAAIPRETLYKAVNREFKNMGLPALHEYQNHYNSWYSNNMAKVKGYWTDDIKFMDWILGDDNKRNVASAWVYNEEKRCNELKQIKSWNWIEAKTGRVLAFINKTDDLTTKDVILSLIMALKENGLPNQGIIIDNGIGSSKEFKEFFERLNFGIEYYQCGGKIILKLGKPYHPTSKAPIERSFGWTKDEFDGYNFKNFVGDNHKKEGIHTSNSLTPEKADYSFEEYDRLFRQYIGGYYETRPRTRIINGKRELISIRDYWDREMESYAIKPLDERVLRYAMMIEKELTIKTGVLNISIEGYVNDYLPVNNYSTLPPSFYNKRFKILYSPADLSNIDLYAMEEFIDRVDGLDIKAGDYICTLASVGKVDEKSMMISKYNNNVVKEIKKMAVKVINVDTDSVINQDGRVIDTPKLFRRELNRIISEEKPMQKIIEKAEKQVKERLEERRLTIDELDEIIQSSKQSYKI